MNVILSLQKTFLVYIISNGGEGWIKRCLTVLPQFSQLYELKIVRILSARDLFSDCFEKTYEWKEYAFKLCVTESFKNARDDDYQHILSIGDGTDEHHALMTLSTYDEVDSTPKKKRILSSVQLMKRPTFNDVLSQIDQVEELLEEIKGKMENTTYILKGN